MPPEPKPERVLTVRRYMPDPHADGSSPFHLSPEGPAQTKPAIALASKATAPATIEKQAA
jgi:hypothetical protein